MAGVIDRSAEPRPRQASRQIASTSSRRRRRRTAGRRVAIEVGERCSQVQAVASNALVSTRWKFCADIDCEAGQLAQVDLGANWEIIFEVYREHLEFNGCTGLPGGGN